MNLQFKSETLDASSIVDRWEIKSSIFASMNSSQVKYKICESSDPVDPHHTVFYLHGFGGSLDARLTSKIISATERGLFALKTSDCKTLA